MTGDKLVRSYLNSQNINAMSEHDEARKAIRAILRSAANPELNDEQVATLIEEARTNARIAFGEWGEREVIAIVVEQAISIYETGARRLQRLTVDVSTQERAHDFGPKSRTVDVTCINCGFRASIPELLNGKTSMWGCTGQLPEPLS